MGATDSQPLVPVIAGPTASGKTGLSLELADRLGRIEIVAADSRQIYTGMEIGTAKPAPDERARVPHHMIDLVSPEVNYTAGDFALEARRAIEGIIHRGNLPVVVGGSGFYIRALFAGLGAPTVDQSIYDALVERAEREGYEAIHAELVKVDPESARAHSPNNRVKTFRALTCYLQTGRPYSQFVGGDAIVRAPVRPVHIGLRMGRDQLYDRINRRVLAMIDEGLIDETEGLLRGGLSPDAPGFRTVGYAEALEQLAGRLTLDQTIAAIQQATRRYAKRQLTWFGRIDDMVWVEPSEIDRVAALVESMRAGSG
jgi:tRNA dimethylallyltransferase